MRAHARTISSTARIILCAVLAAFVAVTPVGAYARLAVPASDFVADLCTAVASPGEVPSTRGQPDPHPATHAQCGDCSTCSIGLAPLALPGTPAVLGVETPLDAIGAPTPPTSLIGGITARPRGPPPS